MKAVVAAFNQEKALVGAFSVITNLRMELFGALVSTIYYLLPCLLPIVYITMDRLWPTQLLNKDSRIRRELSAQGRDCFSCKDYDETLGR